MEGNLCLVRLCLIKTKGHTSVLNSCNKRDMLWLLKDCVLLLNDLLQVGTLTGAVQVSNGQSDRFANHLKSLFGMFYDAQGLDNVYR